MNKELQSFNVGKVIVEKVGAITKLSNKIFPMVANSGTQFPFCVYRRASYSPSNTKDGIGEIADIEIIVLSTKYNESLQLANEIAQRLHGESTNEIEEIQLINAFETFSEDTFIQTMNFRFIYK